MEETKLKITGMTCPKCAERVEKKLRALPGVASAAVTLESGAIVKHSGVSADTLKSAVASAGTYRAEVA